MEAGDHENLERRLLAEIRRINKTIADLEEDRRSVSRILMRARRENLSNKEVTRLTSIKKVVIERTLLNYLEGITGKSISTRFLKKLAEQIEPDLNDSTFRSHLHRMKVRELIESPAHGRWRIANRASQERDGR